IFVFRVDRVPVAAQIPVIVNRESIGELANGTFVTATISPGTTELRIGQRLVRTLTLTAKASQSYFVRVQALGSQIPVQIDTQSVSESEGRRVIAQSRHVGVAPAVVFPPAAAPSIAAPQVAPPPPESLPAVIPPVVAPTPPVEPAVVAEPPAITPAPTPETAAPPGPRRTQGYVQEAFGNVSGRVGAGRPQKVETGQTLPNDSIISTGLYSYVVMKFEDGTAVFLRENSHFQVQNYDYDPKAPQKASAIFNLMRGGIKVVTGLVTSRNRNALKVVTPLATMEPHGTEVAAELVNPLFLQVISGSCTLVNSAGTVSLSAGQAAIASRATNSPNIIPMSQVPHSLLELAKVQLISAPAAIPTGSPVGQGGLGAGTIATIGIAAAAGVAALISSQSGSSAVSHH
ncbi:MAG TPA: FecR domain-containing protein, partial [Terriglobia bacterium]